jgi:hypothetical protein
LLVLKEQSVNVSRDVEHSVRQYDHEVSAPPDRVFPLLCPIRECDWVDGWTADVLHSESGIAEPGCVFTSELAARGEATYLITRYDPAAWVIEFAVFYDAEVVEKLDIALERVGDGTIVHWTRSYTGLTPAGSEFLRDTLLPNHDAHMAYAGEALEHYCATGELLRVGEPAVRSQQDGTR